MIEKNKDVFIQEDINSKQNVNSNLTGNFPTYPKYYGNEFTCFINYLSSINTLPLQIIFKDEVVSELYNDMSFDIQYEVEDMSPLDEIFENKACVALCPEDYNWV